MLWAISNLGISNIINAGGGDHLRLKITRFATGSGGGYTPLASMNALQGTENYTGSLNSYTTQGTNISVFKFIIPGSEPQFDFGEVALYADVGAGEFMFALGVTDDTVTKRLGTQADIYTLLSYNNLSASISFSSNTVTLPVLADSTMLPRLADTTIEQYLMRFRDYGNENGVAMIVKGGGSPRWMVEGFHEIGPLSPVVISGNQVELNISDCDYIPESSLGGTGLILQFIKTGANSDTIIREVVSTYRVGVQVILDYDTVNSAPDLTYDVYLYVSKSYDAIGEWITDFNLAKTAGVKYRFGPGTSNSPFNGYGTLTVSGIPPSSLTHEVVAIDGSLHTRAFDGATWTNWNSYLHTTPEQSFVADLVLQGYNSGSNYQLRVRPVNGGKVLINGVMRTITATPYPELVVNGYNWDKLYNVYLYWNTGALPPRLDLLVEEVDTTNYYNTFQPKRDANGIVVRSSSNGTVYHPEYLFIGLMYKNDNLRETVYKNMSRLYVRSYYNDYGTSSHGVDTTVWTEVNQPQRNNIVRTTARLRANTAGGPVNSGGAATATPWGVGSNGDVPYNGSLSYPTNCVIPTSTDLVLGTLLFPGDILNVTGVFDQDTFSNGVREFGIRVWNTPVIVASHSNVNIPVTSTNFQTIALEYVRTNIVGDNSSPVDQHKFPLAIDSWYYSDTGFDSYAGNAHGSFVVFDAIWSIATCYGKSETSITRLSIKNVPGRLANPEILY
jgi:hypothetical protein